MKYRGYDLLQVPVPGTNCVFRRKERKYRYVVNTGTTTGDPRFVNGFRGIDCGTTKSCFDSTRSIDRAGHNPPPHTYRTCILIVVPTNRVKRESRGAPCLRLVVQLNGFPTGRALDLSFHPLRIHPPRRQSSCIKRAFSPTAITGHWCVTPYGILLDS